MWEALLHRFKEENPILLDMLVRLPSACHNYCVTELKMTALLLSVSLWKHSFSHTDIDCCIDHIAATWVLKPKGMPASHRIGRLLGVTLNLQCQPILLM